MAISKKLILSKQKKPAATDPIFKVNLGTVYVYPAHIDDDARVVALFNGFGLDIKKGGDWLNLLRELSESYFHRGRARPTKWTERSRRTLLADYLLLCREKKITDERGPKLGELIQQFSHDRLYKKSSSAEIYKHLRKAFREMQDRTMSSTKG